jgi:hypothetical protein
MQSHSNPQKRTMRLPGEHKRKGHIESCWQFGTEVWDLAVRCSLILVVGGFFATTSSASTTSGLWVGQVTLNKVNETVGGVNAANQTVFPDPAVTTPVASPAHLQVIFHVDSQGQVRLLKSVAVLPKTNLPPTVALVTDPTLYANFSSSGIGKRIAAAAFDFGDSNAVQILYQVAAKAAGAAANGANATNAANLVLQASDIDAAYSTFVHGSIFNTAAYGAAASAAIGARNRKIAGGTAQQIINDATSGASNDARVVTARTNALALQAAALISDPRYPAAVSSIVSAAANAAASSANSGQTNLAVIGSAATNAVLAAVTNAVNAASPASPSYRAFIASSSFQSSARIAAAAATSAALQASGASQTEKTNRSNAAALKALTDGEIFAAADAVVVNEVPISGSFGAGGTLTGGIYLGASHPTNPFRHRRNPDHTIGYSLSRAVTVQFDSSSGTNAFLTSGFGVDRITGTYREEIQGLHKPLGQSQNIGLIAEGQIVLDRISPVDTLNQ